MRGIYIGITPRNVSTIWTPDGRPTAAPVYTIPPGRGTFEYLFEPLADAMRPLHWWVSHGGFSSSLKLYERLGDEAYDAYGRAVSDRGPSRVDSFLYPAGALPEHADCVANDWAHMVGLDERDGDPFAAAQRLDTADWEVGDEPEAYYALLAETSPLCFYCVDGFVWEVYLRDEARLERFAEHLRSAPDYADRFHLQFGELRDRDRWYSWGRQIAEY